MMHVSFKKSLGLEEAPTPWTAIMDGPCSRIKDANEDYVDNSDYESGISLEQEVAVLIVTAVNKHEALLGAVRAAIAYDNAIRKRVVDGAVKIIDTGGGVAMGDDLDSLYLDWINKARDALGEE